MKMLSLVRHCRDRGAGDAVAGVAVVSPAASLRSAVRASQPAGAGACRSPAAPVRRPVPSAAAPAVRRTATPAEARQVAESGCRDARIVAVVDVPVGGRAGQGGHDRSCLRLARDLDHLHRQDDRAVAGPAQAAHGARARSAMRGRWPKRSSRSAPRAACCRRCWPPRCARRGCRRAFPATPASRSARPRALPKSCAPKRGGSGSAWGCSPPSARPRRSSGCSAPSGAS